MALAPHEELYRMQRQLYLRNKEIIESSILVKEPGFKAYEARYRRKVAKYERISSDDEMLSAIMDADIIYVGDYHTCKQSQRSFLRILKAVIKKRKKIAIGLELIHRSNQTALDKFMGGYLSEKAFLKKIGFHQHWIFDLWENFKPIFDFAAYHRVPVIALDAARRNAGLKERDEAAGRLIADYALENPGRKIFVLIGDLHLAPEHLPFEVEMAVGNSKAVGNPKSGSSKPEVGITNSKISRLRTVILYQNSEEIYWKLAKEGIEDRVSVVRIDDASFCRMHTPPVIAQQSYINWLEHEEGEIDYADAKMSFLELVNRISRFLGIRLKKRDKESVDVYTSGDLSFLKRLKRKKGFTKKDFETIKKQVLSSESYYIAAERIVYLANLSVNHAAEEAAHFIKSLCAGPEEPRYPVDAFYANILHEALGFFGSKLINSKRKCAHEKEFKNLVNYFHSVRIPPARKLEYETAYLINEYLKYEKKGRPLEYSDIFEQRTDLFMSITHALGYILGDKMYYAFKEGIISRISLKYLFYDRWESPGTPFKVYSSLREKTRHVKIPKRM